MPRHRGAGSRSSRWSSLAVLGPVRRCALLLRCANDDGEPLCTWCGVVLTRDIAEVDHVVPRREGGSDRSDNLVGACPACNLDRPEGWQMPAVLALPVDLAAGRRLALAWYPWLPSREAAQHEAKRRRREQERAAQAAALAEGLGGDAFPFGASAP